MMKIRIATMDDVEVITSIAKEFYSQAPLKNVGLNFDHKGFQYALNSLMQNDMTVFLLADMDNAVIGMIAGVLAPWMGNPEQKLLHELWFYLSEEHRGKGFGPDLIEAFSSWGREKGACGTMMANIGNFPSFHNYYGKLGFSCMETFFIKMER